MRRKVTMRATVPTTHGDRIKIFRERKGLDQWELGERVGLGSRQISMIECNKASLPLERAKAIADALGVTLNDLVAEDDKRETYNDNQSAVTG